jgi:hypothetical protein
MLAAVLASGVGIAINVATDLSSSVVAWVVVGVLTLAAGVVTVWASPAASDSGGGTQNAISGTVGGTAVQARDITGPVTFTNGRTPPDHQNHAPSDPVN